MNKLIATLIAGVLSASAFAATTTTITPTPVAVQKSAESSTKDAKKTVHKAAKKSSGNASTPQAKTPVAIK